MRTSRKFDFKKVLRIFAPLWWSIFPISIHAQSAFQEPDFSIKKQAPVDYEKKSTSVIESRSNDPLELRPLQIVPPFPVVQTRLPETFEEAFELLLKNYSDDVQIDRVRPGESDRRKMQEAVRRKFLHFADEKGSNEAVEKLKALSDSASKNRSVEENFSRNEYAFSLVLDYAKDLQGAAEEKVLIYLVGKYSYRAALSLLADSYMNGYKIHKSHQKAAFYLYELCKQSDQDYIKLQIIPRLEKLENNLGIPVIEKLSDAGNLRAKAIMSELYWTGAGVDKNMEKSVKLLENLIDVDPWASYDYAICLLKGIGVGCDVRKAEECFKISAAKGYPPGMLAFAWCNLSGLGETRNFEDAYLWSKKALAENASGSEYLYGLSVYARMIELGNKGDHDGQNQLQREWGNKARPIMLKLASANSHSAYNAEARILLNFVRANGAMSSPHDSNPDQVHVIPVELLAFREDVVRPRWQ